MRVINYLIFSVLVLLNVSIFADVPDLNQMTLGFSQNLSQSVTLEVTKITPWKDCDMPEGKTFILSDNSKWYSTGANSPAFHLNEGQYIIVIPMTDDEAIRYQDHFRVFPSRAYWIILHNKNSVLKLAKAYRINW